MTEIDINRMARQAELYADHEYHRLWEIGKHKSWRKIRKEHFFNLATAYEREACAKVCDDHIGDGDYMAERIAVAIRARGQA